MKIRTDRPGVVLLGGLANSVALTRSFGREGIHVTVCARKRCPAHYSRFCKQNLFPEKDESDEKFWVRALIYTPVANIIGNVLFACNDEAIDFIARHEDTLAEKFLLEKNPGAVRLALLNKKQSMMIAADAGLLSPSFASVTDISDVNEAIQEKQLPLLVRPILSHEFTAVFDQKLILCETGTEVEKICRKALSHGIGVTLCEYIPGPDNRLCSYYTYMDDQGQPLFAFTKRVVRRHPFNFGEGSYHVTKWIPEVAVAGQKFFNQAGLRGLGNIEFKSDPRDGKLKFIECNARFTAAHEIFIQSEFDIGLFVYGQLAGVTYELPEKFIEDVKMSIAFRDLRAIYRLSRQGKASLLSWIPETLGARARPYFQWSDPGPAIARAAKKIL